MSKFTAYVTGMPRDAKSRIADKDAHGGVTFFMTKEEFNIHFPNRKMTWPTLRKMAKYESERKVDIFPVIGTPVGWR